MHALAARAPAYARAGERGTNPKTAHLGFAPPPVPLRIKMCRQEHFWSLFLQGAPSGGLGRIADWLEPHRPLRIEFGSRHVLRADFDPLPSEWAMLSDGVTLDALSLDPCGRAVLSATGPRIALARLAARLASAQCAPEVRHMSAAHRAVRLLTPRQDEAIRVAYAQGYYDIPRPLNLRQLAAQVGVSSASYSEVLRRAEGRVIERYIHAGAADPWDGSTLYDRSPLIGHAALARSCLPQLEELEEDIPVGNS